MEVKIVVVIQFGLLNNFFFLPVILRIGACLSVTLPSNATNLIICMLVFTSLSTIEYSLQVPEEKVWIKTWEVYHKIIYSNKRHGAYLIFRATSSRVVFIRGLRLFKQFVPDKFTFSIC